MGHMGDERKLGTRPRARRTGLRGSAVLWGLLAALLLWCQLAFVRQLRQTGEFYREGRVTYHQTWLWRPGLRPTEQLGAFLDRVREVVPAGSLALFSSHPTSERQDFARYMWAAYLLPEHDLVSAARTPAAARAAAEYWIAYRTTEDHPTLTPLWQHRDGVVYRIEP